jgi:hypothetical protein
MSLRKRLVLAALVCSVAASAQIINTLVPDAFQVRYAANLKTLDSEINITNIGASSPGNLCVSIYSFDPGEEMLSCCSCIVTPNAVQSISVLYSLLDNTVTGGNTSTGGQSPSAVIELVATADATGCNAYTPGTLAPGLRAWGTTLHARQTTGYAMTETEFSFSELSQAEYNHLTDFCAFITPNGLSVGFGGAGLCASCKFGGV